MPHAPATADLVDLALCGLARPPVMTVTALVDGVRDLLRPTVEPTRSFVTDRIEAAVAAGRLGSTACGMRHVVLTGAGRARFEELMAMPAPDHAHPLAELFEILRLTFLPDLPPGLARKVAGDMIRARRDAIRKAALAEASLPASEPLRRHRGHCIGRLERGLAEIIAITAGSVPEPAASPA